MNANWPRWIHSSLQKHFDGLKGSWFLFIEGQKRPVTQNEKVLELRIDGPEITELSKNVFRLYVEINILVQAIMNDNDLHRIHKGTGIVIAAFTNGIAIYQYGDATENAENDDSLLGCMQLITDHKGKQAVKVANFGQIHPQQHLIQATVEGHYEMKLTT